MSRLCHLILVSGFHRALQRSRQEQTTSVLNQTKPNQNEKEEKEMPK